MARHSRGYPPTLKRLGQHFLSDPRVVTQIADALLLDPTDTVVEIGPGRGVLTDLLADRAARVIAVELDRALAEMLRKRYADRASVTIIEQDVLEVPLGDVGGPSYVLAGNVPYYITTPILFHALHAPMPRRAVFLVQKEVAERAVAAPGGKIYGALSVNLQALTRVEHVVDVPAGAFRPPPSVESAVMRVTPLDVPLIAVDEQPAFQKFVLAIFGYRRKQMVRVLRSMAPLDGEQASALLIGVGIDPAARPETLSPPAFAALFRAVRQSER